MSNERFVDDGFEAIDDELVELYHKIEENTGKPEYHVFISEYIAKYMEREDLKSGMRRYLINELINGVKVNDCEKVS